MDFSLLLNSACGNFDCLWDTTYIQYLWVRQQTNLNDKTVIYIPTEGNLPLLEAGRNVKQ